MPDPALLEVGHIDKAHGLRGEVIVTLVTDREERLAPGSVLATDEGPLTVGSAHRHQHRWRVQFEGIVGREQAEALRGRVLRAAPLDDDGTLWVHRLVGSVVVLTDGTELGTCTAVVANPAHDLVELDNGGLVPLVFVVTAADGRIVVDPPEGLVELWATDGAGGG